jgi:thiamine kinase-like enzyme
VYGNDGFAVTLWTYYEPVSSADVAPVAYAQALGELHAGMRAVDIRAPHFTDRVAEAHRLVASPDLSPELGDEDRTLLTLTLATLGREIGQRNAAQQLLHGEPHPGNVLDTKHGLLFIDLETCCIGPVEFDLAYAPDEVSDHYPNVDLELLRDCRLLMLAMVTAWRWDRHDLLPNGRQLAEQWINQLRTAVDPSQPERHARDQFVPPRS